MAGTVNPTPKKIREHLLEADGNYTIVHRETDAAIVKLTVQNGVVKTNVQEEVEDLRAALLSAYQNKGKVNQTGNSLPATDYKQNWCYFVAEDGTYAGQECEVGDHIVCIKDYDAVGGAQDSDWSVIQVNILAGLIGKKCHDITNDISTYDPKDLVEGGLVFLEI